MDEPQDTGDLMEVPPEQRLDKDPKPSQSPTHAALGDGGADDVSDVEEGEVVAPEDFQGDPQDESPPAESETENESQDGGAEDAAEEGDSNG